MTKGAGAPITDLPRVALQDDSGNNILQADGIDVFAQISSYRPDPRFPQNMSHRAVVVKNNSIVTPALYAGCIFNPFTGNQEDCVEYTKFPTKSIGGVADLAMESVDGGNLKASSLHLQWMGFYTFRFNSEALVSHSNEFFVQNDLGARIEITAQPGTSSCSPGP